MASRDVVVLGAARSAIGTFNGSLADMEPHELAGTVMKEAVARSGVDPFAAPDWGAAEPPPILRFATLVTGMTEAGVTPSGLLYQLWDDDITGTLAPPQQLVTALAAQLRDSFATVDAQFALGATEPDTPTLTKLLTAVMGDTDTQLLLGVLNNSLITTVAPYARVDGALPAPVRTAARQALSAQYPGLLR